MRTTGVRLVAETSTYKREMRESAKVTRDVKDELDSTAASGTKMGDGLSKAAKASTRDLVEMRRHAVELDRQIATTQRGITSLAKGFAVSGDTGIFKALREQQRQLRQLKNIRSLLPDAAEVAAAGVGVGTKLIGGIKSAMTSASPAALGASAVGLLLAPAVGAAVAGAVVGAAGLGGVAGGLILAARNPMVKAAGATLAEVVLSDLMRRSAQFVPPTLAGIERVRQGWQTLGPDLDRVFRSSRFVEPLIDGAITGARAFISGFADAIDAADPVIEALRNGLAQIGIAAGDAFRLLSQDAAAGASAINDVTMAVSNLITTTAGIIHAGAQVKEYLDVVDEWIDKGRYLIEDWTSQKDALNGVSHQLDLTADGFAVGTVQAEAYRRATIGTATAADFATLKQAGWTDAKIAGADASGRYRAELAKVKAETQAVAAATQVHTATQEDLKRAQQSLTVAQQEYTLTLDRVSPTAGRATQMVDGLRKATQNLYGAQIQATDANEAYEASWDDLSAAVKKNGRSLDIHTVAGRTNRDTLQQLLTSSKEMYFADIQGGMATDKARGAHERRTEAVRKESVRLKLNTGDTQRLITTYGRIPNNKTTNLVLAGVEAVADAMLDLAAIQLHLAKGTPISGSLAKRLARAQYGMPDTKRAHGGPVPGSSPHARADNIPLWATAKEWVIQRPTVETVERRHGAGAMAYFNKYGELPHDEHTQGHAYGGLVRASQTPWPRNMNYRVTGGMTKVPSLQQVIAAVPVMMGNPGNWPSSPGAQRGDSGVWRAVLRMIRATGPLSGSFGNAYRPGDPKWHGSGRAVDWMGYNQDALATYLSHRRPLELIHRTRNRDYAYTRGRNKGSFNNALMEAHRNHIHIAMANGGVIREPVFGVGASGTTYSIAENGPERVVPMGSGGSSSTTTVINLNVALAAGANMREAGRQIAEQLGSYLTGGGSVVVRGATVLP